MSIGCFSKNRLDMYSQKRKTLSGVIKIDLNAGNKEPYLSTGTIYRYDPFFRYQDENTQAFFLVLSCNRWLALRLDLLSSLFVTIVAFGAIFLTENPGEWTIPWIQNRRLKSLFSSYIEFMVSLWNFDLSFVNSEQKMQQERTFFLVSLVSITGLLLLVLFQCLRFVPFFSVEHCWMLLMVILHRSLQPFYLQRSMLCISSNHLT